LRTRPLSSTARTRAAPTPFFFATLSMPAAATHGVSNDSKVPQDFENVYYASATGHILAAPRVLAATKRLPYYGIVSIALDDAPIVAQAEGRTYRSHAIAFCGREVEFSAAPTRFVALSVNPLHPSFRAFTQMSHPVMELDRGLFQHLEPLLLRALAGSLTHDEAKALLDGVHLIVRPRLPVVPKRDARAQVLLQELWMNPESSLDELAERLGLSYHRTSHYFVEAVGISVRTYRLWQKLYRAAPLVMNGASLTEAAHAAGFLDSAHYSNAYQHAYGRAPSLVFHSRKVLVHTTKEVCEARSAPVPSAEVHDCLTAAKVNSRCDQGKVGVAREFSKRK
jgi:AraC-like DNA-binding protein